MFVKPFCEKVDESHATLLPGKSGRRIFHVPQFPFFFSLHLFLLHKVFWVRE